MVETIFDDNPEYICVWMIAEPTEKDKEFIDFKGSNEAGKLIPGYFRDKPFNSSKEVTPTSEGDLTRVNYYLIPKQNLKINLLPPYKDNLIEGSPDSLLLTSVTVSIMKNNKFQGIIGIDLTLDYIKDVLSKIKPYENGFVFITSQDNKIIGHHHENLNLTDVNSYLSNLSESDYIVKQYPFTITGNEEWKFYVVVSKSKVFAELNKIRFIFIIVSTIIVLAISYIVSFTIGRIVTKQINKLKKLAIDISNGIFPDYKITSKNEIGELEKSFIKVKETIVGITTDIGIYEQQQKQGDWDYELNSAKYNNEYKKLVDRINDISNLHIGTIKSLLDTLENIKNGNLGVEIKNYPGKQHIITETFNEFIQTLNNLVNN